VNAPAGPAILDGSLHDWTFDALEAHYRTLVRYLHFDDCGEVLGRGCGTPVMTKRSRYPKEAYELGRRL
jgi:hypothetical protein